MLNLFSKSKKFVARCELTNTTLTRETAYLISSAQILASKKFWDHKMTEPDTMPYTEAFFKKNDQTARKIREMIFHKFTGQDKAWIISDSQVHLFEVDENQAREFTYQWWDSKGKEVPQYITESLTNMDQMEFEDYKKYAIEEAGKKSVNF